MGKTYTLKATVYPANASDPKITWSSSNKNVVTVKNGKVTAKKAGTAVVTVKSNNGYSAKCKITVKAN